jgi:23S rRNA pseudouridine2605 synthase
MEDTTIRLNKYLAKLGIASRRDIKTLLKQQIVTVNGQRVKESGFRIDHKKDDIRLNGNKIKPPKLVYYLLNKPKGIVSTTADEYGRKNVISLVPTKERIYPVGRLDKDTSGLIILTNDGELTNLLIHPRFHVDKVYRLRITGEITKEQLHALRNGVLLDDGITAPAHVSVLKNNIIEMTIHEGRNRQIRRMCETVGIKLLELQRIKFGPLSLGNLSSGKFRELTKREIILLHA